MLERFLLVSSAVILGATFMHSADPLTALPFQPQYVATTFNPGASGSPTPGFVSETSKNSTLTNALGANPTGQTACAAYSYCVPYAEPALAGNLGYVGYEYENSTAVTPTATDDKSDSYTCVNGSQDSGTSKWTGACYSPNLTAGAHLVTITFGTTAVTQVQAKAGMAYNIATSSPLDTSGSAAGASSTTANAVTISPTVAKDFIWALVCRAGTPLVTGTPAFTAGSGFTLGTEENQDGCASEWEVDAGTGSITPSMTMANASTYTEIVLAFKASSSSQGSAPSGFYLAHLKSWSTASGQTATSWPLQFTSSGNLLVGTAMCGGSTPMQLNSISDSGNSWTQAGTVNQFSGSSGYGSEFYVPNAAADSNGSLTMNTTGTGDCDFTLRDFVGAITNPYTNRLATGNNSVPAGSSVTFTNAWLPWSTTSLVIVNGGLAFNTALTVAAPSGCYADMASFGGMSVSGPEPVDQNNAYDHCYSAGTGNQTFTQNVSSSTLAVGNLTDDFINFLSPTGIGIINTANNQGTSSASLAITVPSTTAGNLLAVAIGNYNSTARTVSKVCTDGTTCAAGNSFTQVPSAASVGTSLAATDVWYLANAKAGVTTVTVTLSGSATNVEGMYYEVEKGNGGTWAVDNSGSGAHVSNGSVSSSTATGASITPTGTADFCVANVGVSNQVTANPKSGNAFIYPGVIFSNTSDAATSLLTTSSSAQTPAWTDASGTFSSSTVCFK
jgi:hypothetical protein